MGRARQVWQQQQVTVAGTAELRVAVVAPALVLVRATFPAATPLAMVVAQGGQAIARGEPEGAGIDRASAVARAEVARAGEIVVTLSGPPGSSVTADVVSAVIARAP